MTNSNINIGITLDDEKMPEDIRWSATETSADEDRKAKAMFLSFWDGEEKAALRIDLWTKSMMVDEMADFFFQIFMSMGDTYQRATRNEEMANDIKKFAKDFYKKFQDTQVESK